MNELDEQTTRAYSYIRWSSDEQESGDSEHRQRYYALQTAKTHKLKIEDFFIDAGMSGYKGDNLKPKSELNRLKRTVQSGDYILVENADRITRKGVHTLLDILKELTDKGVKLICNGIELDGTNYDKELNTLISSRLGNDESEKKAVRVIQGMSRMKELIRQGVLIKHNHMPPWLKYIEDKYGRVVGYEEIPEKVKLIQRIFDLYVSGLGMKRLVTVLNKENTPPLMDGWYAEGKNRQFKGWWTQTLQGLLTNKAVIGLCTYVNPPVPYYKPIIDENLFWSVQQSISDRRNVKLVRGKRISKFGGIVRCADCEAGMVRVNSSLKKDGSRKTYWICSHSYIGKCHGGYTRYDYFNRALHELLSRHEMVVSTITSDKPISPAKLDSLKGQLDDCRKQQVKLTDLICNEANPPKMLMERLQQFEIKERELSKAIDFESALVKGHTPVHKALEKYQKFKDKWDDEQSQELIRECLKSMIDKIELDRLHDSFKVYLKGGGKKPIDVSYSKDGCIINRLNIKWID